MLQWGHVKRVPTQLFHFCRSKKTLTYTLVTLILTLLHLIKKKAYWRWSSQEGEENTSRQKRCRFEVGKTDDPQYSRLDCERSSCGTKLNWFEINQRPWCQALLHNGVRLCLRAWPITNTASPPMAEFFVTKTYHSGWKGKWARLPNVSRTACQKINEKT